MKLQSTAHFTPRGQLRAAEVKEEDGLVVLLSRVWTLVLGERDSALPPTFTHPCCLICLSFFSHHGGGFGPQGQYNVSYVSCMHVKPESGQTYTCIQMRDKDTFEHVSFSLTHTKQNRYKQIVLH